MDRFKTYMDAIELSPAIQDRINDLVDTANEVNKEMIEDIFVSEYLNADGTKVYESLWFFSPRYISETKQFRTSFILDVAVIDSRIHYYEIDSNGLGFKSINGESKTSVNFSTVGLITGTLKATGENCKHLKHIFSTYIRPNCL